MPGKLWWYSYEKNPWVEGVILGLDDGESVPTGWTSYTDADGYFLKGTNLDGDVKDTDTQDSPTYYTSYNGGHTTAGSPSLIRNYGYWGGSYGSYGTRNEANAVFSHRHLCTVTYRPPSGEINLIVAGASAEDPIGAIMIGTGANADQTAFSDWDGTRYLRANTSTGTDAGTKSLNIGGGGSSHDHINIGTGGALYTGTNTTYSSIGSAGASHTHGGTVSPTITPALKQILVRAFKIVKGDSRSVQGLIGMWDQAGAPEGWSVLADFNGRYLKFSSSGTGATSGDNTIDVSASPSSYSHAHSVSGASTGSTNYSTYYHTASSTHNHTWTSSGEAYQPANIKIKFIQYVG